MRVIRSDLTHRKTRWFSRTECARITRFYCTSRQRSWESFIFGIHKRFTWCSILHSVLFVDDTFFLSANNFWNLIESFNQELGKVGRWLIGNRLSLNFTKTVAMNFTKQKSVLFNKKIENHDICFVECTKYLGAFIDRT